MSETHDSSIIPLSRLEKKKIIKGSFHSENGFTIHFNFLQGPSDFRERLI